MAGPDNVARIIAAGSALITGVNMAVSYATYVRKRPRLAVKVSFADAPHYSIEGGVRSYLVVHLANRGEATVRAVYVGLDTAWGERPRSRQFGRLRRKWQGGAVAYVLTYMEDLSLESEFPVTLGAFEESRPLFRFGGCLKELNELPERKWHRASVGLPGGRHIYSPWVEEEWLSCGCAGCTPLAQQLTFDDLNG
ncbi:hypothetical protein [Streptomyces hyaluromycini]|uniref:hypothetical protein n=1 Tax=Streptomyces hyaluromycini TaxID=1377993 RepID=UPI000B5C4454|nr:hypothetical protein [Streptomyces hyaluromycini]